MKITANDVGRKVVLLCGEKHKIKSVIKQTDGDLLHFNLEGKGWIYNEDGSIGGLLENHPDNILTFADEPTQDTVQVTEETRTVAEGQKWKANEPIRQNVQVVAKAERDRRMAMFDEFVQKAHDNLMESVKCIKAEDGKTLRDEFAMAALTGILAHVGGTTILSEHAAEWAFRQADAMMKARQQ